MDHDREFEKVLPFPALVTELTVVTSFVEDILEAPYEWHEDILEAPIEDFPSILSKAQMIWRLGY